MTITVVVIPQDSEWRRSFNVLVPLEIQGKTGTLISPAEGPNTRHGSIAARIEVEGKVYGVPGWAVKAQKQDLTIERLSYSI